MGNNDGRTSVNGLGRAASSMPAAAKGPWSAVGPRPLPRLTSTLSRANLAAAGGALAKQVAAKRCKNGAESICRSLCWIWSTGGCTLFAPLLGGGGAGCAHPSSTPAQDPSVCEGLSLLRDQQPVLPSHVQPSLCPLLARVLRWDPWLRQVKRSRNCASWKTSSTDRLHQSRGTA